MCSRGPRRMHSRRKWTRSRACCRARWTLRPCGGRRPTLSESTTSATSARCDCPKSCACFGRGIQGRIALPAWCVHGADSQVRCSAAWLPERPSKHQHPVAAPPAGGRGSSAELPALHPRFPVGGAAGVQLGRAGAAAAAHPWHSVPVAPGGVGGSRGRGAHRLQCVHGGTMLGSNMSLCGTRLDSACGWLRSWMPRQ